MGIWSSEIDIMNNHENTTGIFRALDKSHVFSQKEKIEGKNVSYKRQKISLGIAHQPSRHT